MNDARFYEQLPVFDRFEEAIRPTGHRPLPDRWHLAISDVAGSTEAAASGRYKQVNALSAATIMGVLNRLHPLPVPYVFGGDGAVLAVPASGRDEAADVLASTRRLAAEQFDLDLRVALVPVGDLRRAGSDVRLGLYRLSDHCTLAQFSGGGLELADRWIKDPQRGRAYLLRQEGAVRGADYNGFECRWRDIQSAHGSMVTLLVRATEMGGAAAYDKLLRLLGRNMDDRKTGNPARLESLQLARSGAAGSVESRIRAADGSLWRRWLYCGRLAGAITLGRFLFASGVRCFGVDWGIYRRDLVRQTDHRKFDDMLRMVLDMAPAPLEELKRYLAAERDAGHLVYGLHESSAALMTCLVFNRQNRHVHFVDGAGGGYARAAEQLKSQRV